MGGLSPRRSFSPGGVCALPQLKQGPRGKGRATAAGSRGLCHSRGDGEHAHGLFSREALVLQVSFTTQSRENVSAAPLPTQRVSSPAEESPSPPPAPSPHLVRRDLGPRKARSGRSGRIGSVGSGRAGPEFLWGGRRGLAQHRDEAGRPNPSRPGPCPAARPPAVSYQAGRRPQWRWHRVPMAGGRGPVLFKTKVRRLSATGRRTWADVGGEQGAEQSQLPMQIWPSWGLTFIHAVKQRCQRGGIRPSK